MGAGPWFRHSTRCPARRSAINSTSVTAPLATGSVSLRLYPHNDLPPSEIVTELRVQATLAVQHGFDGVMTSEHHGGFAGYLPNPLQVAGWCLDAMPAGWAAPCPLLLPLRPPALVAEEIAWLAARFPDRVGVGVAAGALPADFEIMGLTMVDLADRFSRGLEQLVGFLHGSESGPLADDPAVAACAQTPIPIVSAAMGFTAARRAARLGVGLLFDSLSTPPRCRELTDAYRDAGGSGPCILIRRAWLGEVPRGQVEQQLDRYRSYTPRGAQAHWGDDELVGAADASTVAGQLADAVHRAGADALNLRVHFPGVPRDAARAQIAGLGDTVVPIVRTALNATRPGAETG
jgi:alkanesulfonate monooxygenase SsuD/methylene tetrahydromethanopterin reductase-like flavin-dependent oxidoreductase (luciferase family)